MPLATVNGVQPRTSRASSLAPCSTRNSTTALTPRNAAPCSGVSPASLAALTSLPSVDAHLDGLERLRLPGRAASRRLRRRTSMPARRRPSAASCRRRSGIRASAPAAASTFMTSTSVFLAARKNAVAPSRFTRLRWPSFMPFLVMRALTLDAPRDQLLDDIDAVERAGRHRAGRVAEVRPAAVNRLVQRIPSRAREVRIGAAVEQQVGQLPVGVGGGDDQRAFAVRQRVVDVGARIEQRSRAVEAAGADREQQRA